MLLYYSTETHYWIPKTQDHWDEPELISPLSELDEQTKVIEEQAVEQTGSTSQPKPLENLIVKLATNEEGLPNHSELLGLLNPETKKAFLNNFTVLQSQCLRTLNYRYSCHKNFNENRSPFFTCVKKNKSVLSRKKIIVLVSHALHAVETNVEVKK